MQQKWVNSLVMVLLKALAGTKGFVTVRHAGLMIGVELDKPCGDLVNMAREAKLLINVTADKVVTLITTFGD